jgi:hypothetical protein
MMMSSSSSGNDDEELLLLLARQTDVGDCSPFLPELIEAVVPPFFMKIFQVTSKTSPRCITSKLPMAHPFSVRHGYFYIHLVHQPVLHE